MTEYTVALVVGNSWFNEPPIVADDCIFKEGLLLFRRDGQTIAFYNADHVLKVTQGKRL